MPILVPWTLFSDIDLDKLNSQTNRTQRAKSVSTALNRWRRPQFPERPPDESTDEQIVGWIRRLTRGEKLLKAEREPFLMFATWRKAVWKKEHEAAANLFVLLHAVSALELAGLDASSVRKFIEEDYDCKLPQKLCDGNIRQLARVSSQNLELLPPYLRDGSGFHETGAKQSVMNEPTQESLL